jgi:hypothetical protein
VNNIALLRGLAKQLHGTIYRVDGHAFDPGIVLNRHLDIVTGTIVELGHTFKYRKCSRCRMVGCDPRCAICSVDEDDHE